MVYSQSSPQPIDREQVRQQLATLGYKAGDTVYLRAFYPDSDPRKTKDAGRKAFATKLDHLIKHATTFQASGRGIYLVVNGGGHKDKDVTQTRAIFYEHDSLDKSLQLDLWKDLGLPEPTLQVDTGGKSIHSYWVFDESVVVEDWRELQTDLLEFADADRSLKNPSRVMRLAGAWHSSGNQSVIVSNSGKRYTYADLRAIVPTPEKTEPLLFQPKLHLPSTVSRCEDITIPVPASIPLEECLAKSSRKLLNGISEGGRNEAGAKLARDLIGTANYLRTIGQPFNGDPRQLLEDFGARCNPPLPKRETETVWKSAEGDNPTPACKPEGVENCVRGWYWKNYGEKLGGGAIGGSNNIVTHPRFESSNLSDLEGELDKLLAQDLKRSQLRLKISELAQKYRISPKEIEEIYRLKQEELEEEANQEDTAAEVARLLSTQKAHLELSEILPAQLAAPIEQLAAKLNLKTEVYLAALLTQVSSLFKVGSEVLLRRDTDYRCTPNYFAGNVSESSQKKSPVVKAIIDRPMQLLREKARKEYQKALADYEEEYRQWKAAKGENKGLPPKEPRQRLYSFSKATGEGILYQVAAYPDQALMYRCDELAGLFKSANQYRGGKGSDEEDLLEFWNGTGSTVLRASGAKADVDGLLLSVFGTIQPDVLANLLKDCSDSNGKFARFDFVFQPLAASKLPEEDSVRFDLTPMLSSLYTKIDALAALKMELAPEAKRLFTAFYNATEERRVAEPKQGMRAMIGKMPEKVGKMAAIIHTLTCAFNGVEVSLQIPKSAVEAAIKFVKFSADQIASLYAEFSDRTALAPSLAKIVLLAERKGGTLTVRDCQKSFDSKKRPNAQQVKSWFKDLALMNYGALVHSNKTSSFVITAPTVTNAEKDLPQLESLHSKGSKDNWGNTGGAYLPQLKSLHSKGSEPSVTNCHYFSQPSEIQALKQPEFVEDEKTLFPHSPTVTDVSNTDTALVQDLPQSEKMAPPVVTDVKTAGELKESITPPEEPIANHTGKSKPEIKIGDRVVIARSDNPKYRGVKGEVIADCWGAKGLEFYVRFDKKISNILHDYFPVADVMREP